MAKKAAALIIVLVLVLPLLGIPSIVQAVHTPPAKVVLDPGHGGSDPGAIGPSGLQEKEVNLDIATRLRKKLEGSGCKVIMTRSSDAYVSLEQRVEVANSNAADLLLSIHANAYYLPTAGGSETWCSSSSSPLAPVFASTIQKALVSQTKLRDRGVKTADFYVTKYCQMTSALVEVAFISNPDEEAKLRDPGFRDLIAEGLLNGMLDFLKNRPYGFQVLNISIPQSAGAGDAVPVTIQVQNTGVLTWLNAGADTVRVFVEWTNSTTKARYSYVEDPLPKAVPPGAYFTISWNLKAPTIAGVYEFSVDMLRRLANGSVVFFSAQGCKRYALPVTVGEVPDASAPEDATNFAAASQDQKVLLSWTKSPNSSPDLAQQLLYVSIDDGKSFGPPITLGKDVTSFVVGGLTNGQKYVFKLTCKDSSGNESKGVTASATPGPSSSDAASSASTSAGSASTSTASLGNAEGSATSAVGASVTIAGTSDFALTDARGNVLRNFSSGAEVKVIYDGSAYRAYASDGYSYTTAMPLRFVATGDGVLQVLDMLRSNYSLYRGVLEVRYSEVSKRLWVINELSLFDYLNGINEEPEDFAKGDDDGLKAAAVVYRSYAYAEKTIWRKFGQEPFDISSSTAFAEPYVGWSQHYVGYYRETLGSNLKNAVAATNGEVVVYNSSFVVNGKTYPAGTVVKTPFFSASDGKTRTSTYQYPWCVAVDEPYDLPPYTQNSSLQGHGLGMSMNGAELRAQNGYSYKEIVLYYFSNCSVQKKFEDSREKIRVGIYSVPLSGASAVAESSVGSTVSGGSQSASSSGQAFASPGAGFANTGSQGQSSAEASPVMRVDLANNSLVGKLVNISVAVKPQVKKVAFYCDGKLKRIDRAAPFYARIGVSVGRHVITVVGFDSANKPISQLSLTVVRKN